MYEHTYRVFQDRIICNYGTLTIKDTGTGGRITGGWNKSDYNGGGIYNVQHTLTVNGGSITGNKAYSGGGIYNNDGNSTLSITGGSVTGNTASLGGGVLGTFKIASGETAINITENKLTKTILITKTQSFGSASFSAFIRLFTGFTAFTRRQQISFIC